MTDRYKGFLVTLEKDIRDDDSEQIIMALKMVKGVYSVKPYIANAEDSMASMRTKSEMGQKLHKWIAEELFHLKLEER